MENFELILFKVYYFGPIRLPRIGLLDAIGSKQRNTPSVQILSGPPSQYKIKFYKS